MKDIEKKDLPDVPGGNSPGDGGCFPQFPIVPGEPIGPFPDPVPAPNDSQPFVLEK